MSLLPGIKRHSVQFPVLPAFLQIVLGETLRLLAAVMSAVYHFSSFPVELLALFFLVFLAVRILNTLFPIDAMRIYGCCLESFDSNHPSKIGDGQDGPLLFGF